MVLEILMINNKRMLKIMKVRKALVILNKITKMKMLAKKWRIVLVILRIPLPQF
jgi:hypothetical protein